MNKRYYDQVDLLLTVLPALSEASDLVLKGGTSINLFFRDMPRLSVDIDLALIKLVDRDSSIRLIDSNLKAFANKVLKATPNLKVTNRKSTDGFTRSLLIDSDKAQIKVEANDIIRGSVYPSETKELCARAEDEFGKYTEVQSYSFYDLYAGKICAALDRQHPRDLFDIDLLLKEDGFDEKLRKTFIVYLISHNRPISELLNPNRLDITEPFNKNFDGMTSEPVSIKQLEDAREKLIKLTLGLKAEEKEFLVSFKEGKPSWDLLGLEGIDKLPAVQWKLLNISKMPKDKHEISLLKLKQKLRLT